MTTTAVRTQADAARVATLVVFALNGCTFASWASRIPDVRNTLDLAPGQLGLLLLVGSIGSVLGLPLAGWVAARYGTRNTVLFGATISTVFLALTGVAVDTLHSTVLAGMALFVVTFGIGQWDVAMNLEGATVERHLGRTVMPQFHAAFSLGTVLCALLASGLVALHVPLYIHFPVAAAIILTAVFWCSRAFLPHEAEVAAEPDSQATTPADTGRTRSAWTEPRTLLIGAVTLVAAFTEGTANDWISVAFVDGYHLPAWAGVLGFATFLTFMTIGRLAGGSLLDRYGRVPTLRVMLVLAGIGSLLVVFGTAPLAYFGAAIWGFGISLGFPVGMSAGADDPRRAAARVSVICTIAYGAFLLGPPALGFLGDHWGVLRALSVVSVLLVVALVCVPAVREPEPRTAEPAPIPADTDAHR